ncbi:MAG TPA: hypothetical protein VFU37_23225 [Pyrinomonadaceae bacterium]|nr:hypothetical protein [Pyrinomonadaceae bacterium]
MWVLLAIMLLLPALQQQPRQAQQFLDTTAPNSRMGVDQLPYSKPFYAVLMQHDENFDLSSIPLEDWLKEGDKEEVPWSIQTEKPSVRIDQRIEAPYTATIQANNANKLVGDDLYFIAIVTNRAGQRLIPPKVVHHVIESKLPPQSELRFSDSVLAQPGEYMLWLIFHDSKTGGHNAVRRRIVVSNIDDDPLPNVDKQLLQVELPPLSDPAGGAVIQFIDDLTLPVRNKHPLRLELISVLSPPEQWSRRRDIVRRHYQETASVLNTFAQLQLAQGAISATGLDLNHRTVPFEQKDLVPLDRQRLVDALHNLKDQTISFATLEKGGGSAFLRTSLEGVLEQREDATRVFIIVSSLNVFDRSSDFESLKLRENCKCRVYYLRFRNNTDAFDDTDKIIKPLNPRTFNLSTGIDFRKALAEIIRDLENL